ncbi:hypothetical protein [Acinetobacter puyangensis]|uniref:hypothetical protein n=1 Tax=Acinetobacter puyangensis TaxID=1096779 RepID=UPI003621E12E
MLNENLTISASDLLNATLRTDLVPVPVSLEFTVQDTEQLSAALVLDAQLSIGDFGVMLNIIKVAPLKTQLVKNGRRIGGIACVAIPVGCNRLIQAANNAVILEQTSFNSAYRACGAKIGLGSDLPLPEFICLKGSLPTQRIALYMQQEAAVIGYQNKKICALKIDALFKQEAKQKIDPSAVTWIHSDRLANIEKASYVSVDDDGSTVLGEDTTSDQKIIQRARLSSRQLKNLNKVLIQRGTIMRPLMTDLNAGDLINIDSKNYVIVTAAHLINTGSLGGASAMASKFWIASL